MRRNSNFVLREIYGKNILMPIRYNDASNDPIYFNSVAALIWKLTDDAKDVDDLLCSVCKICNIEKNSVEAVAVDGFIKYLLENNLIFMD